MNRSVVGIICIFFVINSFSSALAHPKKQPSSSSASSSDYPRLVRARIATEVAGESSSSSSSIQSTQPVQSQEVAQSKLLSLPQQAFSVLIGQLSQADQAALKIAALSQNLDSAPDTLSSSTSSDHPSRRSDIGRLNFYNNFQYSSQNIEMEHYQGSVSAALCSFLPIKQLFGSSLPTQLNLTQRFHQITLNREPNLFVLGLNLSGSNITTDDLKFIAYHFPNLETLQLEGTSFGADGLEFIAKLSHLKYLDLSGHGVPQTSFSSSNIALPEPGIFNSYLINYLRDLKNLQTLNLGDNLIQDEQILLLSDLPALTHLDLSDHQLTNASFSLLSHLKNLKSLNLTTFVSRMTSDQAQSLGALVNLESLSLEGLNFQEGQLEFLKPLQKLETLNLARTHLTGEGLKKLAHLTQLKELNISQNSAGTLTPSLKHLSSLTQLQKLELAGTRLQDKDLQFLAPFPQFAALEHLDLENTQITSDALKTVSLLKNLKYLNLASNGDRVLGDGFKYLTSLQGLQSLNLAETSLKSDSLAVLSYFPQLKFLNLKKTGITGDSLKYLSHLTQLEVLFLGENSIPLDLQLEPVGRFKKLRELYLAGNWITAQGFSCLSPLTQLQSLSLGTPVSVPSGMGRLKGFSNLRSLAAVVATDEDFEAIGKFSQLRTLNLAWEPDASHWISYDNSADGIYPNTAFQHFLSLHHLNWLSLKGIENLNQVGVQYIGNIPQLRTFETVDAELDSDMNQLLLRVNPSIETISN